ncbi:MAG: T9SS type A sorting domain-containing protein [bacterium]
MLKNVLTITVLFTVAMLAAGADGFARGNTLWTTTYGRYDAAGDLEVTLTKSSAYYVEPADFRMLEDYHTRPRSTSVPLWSKRIGGPEFGKGQAVIKTPAGGIMTVSYQRTAAGDYRVNLRKTDARRKLLWKKTYSAENSDKLAVTGWTLSFSAGGSEVYALSMAPVAGEESLGQESETTIETFQLSQNHPNPFNPSTTINYSIPKETRVKLKIFNILGQEVVTLVDERQTAGAHKVVFDARRYASGYYVYRLEAGRFVETKKMMLIK